MSGFSDLRRDLTSAVGAPRELVPAEKSALPAEAHSYFSEGLERLNRGEARESARCFERALEKAPQFADAHVGLGIACAMECRIYPALDHLERAVELEPGNFYAHFKLGQLYFKLRIPEKGYAEMSRALECATLLEEKRLIAQLVREERQRERQGVARPWWNKPFSWAAIFLGAGCSVVLLVLLLLRIW